MKYGIIGSGSASQSIINEGLSDILKSDPKAVFLIHARRSPQGAVPFVYDFLFDHEVPFVAYTRIDDNAPKALLSGAQETHKTDDPMHSIIAGADKMLLLWDEENPESSGKMVIACADAGLEILDMTTALTPIVVEESPDNTEEVASIKVGTEEDYAVVGFTREELLNMNIGVLRRQAKSLGLELGRITKEEIVNAILGVNDTPEVASEVPSRVVSEYGEGSITWIQDGALCTEKLSASQIAWLIEELKHQPI